MKTITVAELREWVAYYRVQPWGDDRADLRQGMLTALVANIFGGGKGAKTFKPADFMPFAPRQKTPKKTADQVTQFYRSLANRFARTPK